MLPKYPPSPNELETVTKNFTYHAPKEDQPQRYEELRNMGGILANKISGHCPPSRERSLALTKLQEAIMWANASIACNE